MNKTLLNIFVLMLLFLFGCGNDGGTAVDEVSADISSSSQKSSSSIENTSSSSTENANSSSTNGDDESLNLESRAKACAMGISEDCLIGAWAANGIVYEGHEDAAKKYDYNVSPGKLVFYRDGSFRYYNSELSGWFEELECNPLYGSWNIYGSKLSLSTAVENNCMDSDFQRVLLSPTFKIDESSVVMSFDKLWFLRKSGIEYFADESNPIEIFSAINDFNAAGADESPVDGLGACTLSRVGEVVKRMDGNYYVCKSRDYWESVTNGIIYYWEETSKPGGNVNSSVRYSYCTQGLSEECIVGEWSVDGIADKSSGEMMSGFDYTSSPGRLVFEEDGVFEYRLASTGILSDPDCERTYGKWSISGSELTMKVTVGGLCTTRRSMTFTPEIEVQESTVKMSFGELWFLYAVADDAMVHSQGTEVFSSSLK